MKKDTWTEYQWLPEPVETGVSTETSAKEVDRIEKNLLSLEKKLHQHSAEIKQATSFKNQKQRPMSARKSILYAKSKQ